MMQPLKLQVSLMRLLGRAKAAFADAFTICHNLRSPFALVGADTKEARFVGFGWVSHVLQIAKTRNLSKIAELVVLLVSIFMVYVKRWKNAGHVQPRKSVRQPFLVVNGNCPVPCVGRATGTFTNKIGAAMMFFPDKNASLWVVVKNGLDMVSGNHDFEFTMKAAK
jgi:hypothetical protein